MKHSNILTRRRVYSRLPRFIGLNEAKESLRVSRCCVYHLAMAGEINAFRRGKRLQFETDSLELWLQKIHQLYQG